MNELSHRTGLWLPTRSVILLVGTWILGVGMLPGQESPLTPEQELLKKHQIKTDSAGLLKHLRGLNGQKQIQQLIRQLGSDSFDEREAATEKLGLLGVTAIAELTQAAQNGEAEVKRRAEQALESIESDGKPVLVAVLRLVREARPMGVVAELLSLLPAVPDDALKRAVRETILSSARAEDAALLRQATLKGASEVRATALLALEKVLGREAVPLLRERLKDPEELVRLASARALVEHQPQETLEVLVLLLEANNVRVRMESDRILRGLTGQQFGYFASGEAAERKAAVESWRDWVRQNGKTAKLRLPLREDEPKLGRILLCRFNPYGVQELDAGNKTVFTSDAIEGPCGCQGLANGHRVFADWYKRELVEMDAKGSVVWRKEVGGTPNCLHRLPDGNTLTGLFDQNQVIELKRDGTIAWKAQVDSQPTDTRRLDNGRTLVALHGSNRVIELDRQGKVVWQITDVPTPESARRLANGHTLVGCGTAGEVREYAADGKLVGTIRNVPSAYDALELDNGNILIGYRDGLREVMRSGKVVRDVKVGTVRRISCY